MLFILGDRRNDSVGLGRNGGADFHGGPCGSRRNRCSCFCGSSGRSGRDWGCAVSWDISGREDCAGNRRHIGRKVLVMFRGNRGARNVGLGRNGCGGRWFLVHRGLPLGRVICLFINNRQRPHPGGVLLRNPVGVCINDGLDWIRLDIGVRGFFPGDGVNGGDRRDIANLTPKLIVLLLLQSSLPCVTESEPPVHEEAEANAHKSAQDSRQNGSSHADGMRGCYHRRRRLC